MKIKVKGFFTIKDAMGHGELELEVDRATIKEVLIELSSRYGEKFGQEIFDPPYQRGECSESNSDQWPALPLLGQRSGQ